MKTIDILYFTSCFSSAQSRGSVIQRTTMELPRDELERMIFFEDARKRAEMDHEENPEDAQVPRMNACSSRFSDIFHELTSFSRF